MKIQERRDYRGRLIGYSIQPLPLYALSVSVSFGDATGMQRALGVRDLEPTVDWIGGVQNRADNAGEMGKCLILGTAFVAAHLVRRAERQAGERDSCEVCVGDRHGTPGNENRLGPNDDYIVVCDYCSPRYMATLRKSPVA